MKLTRTKRFKTAYRSLPGAIQKKADKKLKYLADNIKHPSLRAKKIQGTKGILEASVNMNYRFTFEIRKDEYILRNIGLHNKTIKKP